MNDHYVGARTGRAAAALLMIILAGCGGATATPSTAGGTSAPPAGSPSPDASPDTSPAPPDPSAAPSTSFGADSFVQVVTDGLRVRTRPGTGTDSLKLEPLLWNGAMAMVLAGPVVASGYEWYLVKPMAEVDIQVHPDPPAFGWVAAGGDGEAWLEPYPIECHASPLEWLVYDFHQPPIELGALSCLGDSQISFTAQLGREDAGCPDGGSLPGPEWLDPCAEPGWVLAAESGPGPDGDRWLRVAIHPDAGAEALPEFPSDHWLVVNVLGQYDHPAADSCTTASPDTDPAQVVTLGCRARFVVTSISVYSDV